MPDITMCDGGDCPIRKSCKRFTSKPSMRQSFFADVPFEIVDNKVKCEMFWGDKSDEIFNILKTACK
jgi:hypothetical protein